MTCVRCEQWECVGEVERALGAWLGIPGDEVVFTPGATGGTLLALLTLATRDSTVLVESPIYEPMLLQAQRVCRVERFNRRMADGWKLPLDEIADRLRPGVTVVMITEPGNPHGVFSSREDVKWLAGKALKVGAYLLINEVYRGFSGRPSLHGIAANVVVVSSMSKYLGAYTSRVGWLSAQEDTAAMLRAAHRNFSMGSSLGAAAGLAVLSSVEELEQAGRQAAAHGIPIVDKWVRSTPGLSWVPTQGPGFGCIGLPGGTDDVAFAEVLHDRRKVLLVPGTFFDLPGTVRLSWIAAGDRLEQGLCVIADHLKERASR